VLRLALAGNEEYYAFFGDKVKAFENMVKAVQRVNSIYEQDFALKFILVNNNDRILFSSENLYTNDKIDNLLKENQYVIDSIIGSSNYDIGHIFTTSNGGKGVLPSVCIDSVKAMGVTGLEVPKGDKFYVDYFAHELGHQLGANHSYMGRRGFCLNGRWGLTAYEPGSGSTIMGYAGICNDDNVQPDSDDYFHFISLAEINNHLDNMTFGGCGNLISTSNSYPELILKDEIHYIPHSTPFFLTASAFDSNDNAVLTYTWEQFNLDQALIRSVRPDTGITRFIPKTKSSKSAFNDWEMLPTDLRKLDFVLTVRDNQSGAGGVNHALYSVNVEDVGPFEVLSPTANQIVQPLKNLKIHWEVNDTDLPPISCENVYISISYDGGFSFEILSKGVANTGFVEVVIPNRTSSNAVIYVGCSDNIFFNVSDAFTIDYAV